MNINGVVEEISDCGNVDTAAFLEPLDMQPEKFSEGKLISVNEESGCDEKDRHVLDEVMLAKIAHERYSWRYFTSQKIKDYKMI